MITSERFAAQILVGLSLVAGAWGCSSMKSGGDGAGGTIGAGGTSATGGTTGAGGRTGIGGGTGTGGASLGGAGGFATGDAGGPDAFPLGQSYACAGGVVTPPSDAASTPPVDATSTPPPECVVGQSYCHIQLLDHVAGSTPLYGCWTPPGDAGFGVCSTTPSCDCLCAQPGVRCFTECSCSDTGGFATITCHQI